MKQSDQNKAPTKPTRSSLTVSEVESLKKTMENARKELKKNLSKNLDFREVK